MSISDIEPIEWAIVIAAVANVFAFILIYCLLSNRIQITSAASITINETKIEEKSEKKKRKHDAMYPIFSKGSISLSLPSAESKSDDEYIEIDFQVIDDQKEANYCALYIIDRLLSIQDFEKRIVHKEIINIGRMKASVRIVAKIVGDVNDDEPIKKAMKLLGDDSKVCKVNASPNPEQSISEEEEEKEEKISVLIVPNIREVIASVDSTACSSEEENDGKVDEWPTKSEEEEERDVYVESFEMPPEDMSTDNDDDEYFVMNDIERDDNASMPEHTGVIMLTFMIKCDESARNVTQSLMRKLVKISNWKQKVWEKKVEYNEKETKAHVKFILHYDDGEDDIMQCDDMKKCLEVLKAEEKLKGIKVEKYEYSEQSNDENETNYRKSEFMMREYEEEKTFNRRHSKVTKTTAISLHFELNDANIEQSVDEFMAQMRTIENFEHRLHEHKVDIDKESQKAYIELIMSHPESYNQLDDPVKIVERMIHDEARGKHFKVETVPYFIEI